MNQKAEELGLENTHFITPHGLDETEHYTSAYELAKLTDYALNNKKFVNIVGTKSCSITINGSSKNIYNTNELLGYLNGVDGVKTGFTNNAGRCLVTSTTRNGHQIICVVLGADTKRIRTQDSVKLIEYTFSNYEYINVKEKTEEKFAKWIQEESKNIQYSKIIRKEIEYELDEIAVKEIPIPKNRIKDLKVEVSYEKKLYAPIRKEQTIGKIDVILDEEVMLSTNIHTKEPIAKKGILEYLKDLCIYYTNYLNNEIKGAS